MAKLRRIPLPRTSLVNRGQEGGPIVGLRPSRTRRCLQSFSSLSLPYFGDHAELAHHAQNISVGPVFGYLAPLDAADVDARHLNLLSGRGEAYEPSSSPQTTLAG